MTEYIDELKANLLLTESFYYVPGPDNMTPKAEELSEEEIKAELSDILTEEELSEIDVVQGFGQDIVRLTQGEAAVGGAVAAAAIIALATKAAMRFASNPECKKYSGGTMKKCNTIMKLKKKMAAMQAKMSLCKKSKDPASCSAKVKSKIQQTQDKLKTLGPIAGTD